MQKGQGVIFIIVGILVLVIAIGGAYYWGRQSTNKPQTSVAPFPNTQVKQLSTRQDPKYGAFMRKGEIYFKDFTKDQELKISKTPKVMKPNLSSSGKYVYYFSVIHSAGGFPRGNVYVADTKATFETLLGLTNPWVGRLNWSKDNDYLGFIIFPDGENAKAIIYDASSQKRVAETTVITLRTDTPGGVPTLVTDKSYNMSLGCSKLEIKYQSFCTEYEAILNTEQDIPDQNYKGEQYQNSEYTKSQYQLSRSQKLDNSLVILEYYTGEPQNPESKWGIGGGSFIPGYDEGVTETYTLLLDESTSEIVTELPLAIDADFLF